MCLKIYRTILIYACDASEIFRKLDIKKKEVRRKIYTKKHR